MGATKAQLARRKDWENAPKNGSYTHPYSFKVRMDPEENARFHKIFGWIRSEIIGRGCPLRDAVVAGLLALEHLRRHMEYGDTQQKNYAREFFRTLRIEDHLVNRGKKLIASGVITQAHFDQFIEQKESYNANHHPLNGR